METDDRTRAASERPRPIPITEHRDTASRVLAAAAVRWERKVLVLREEDEPYHGSWVLPQGYPHPGETLPSAAVREVSEELGLDVAIDGLLGVYEDFTEVESRSNVHVIIVSFRAHSVGGSRPRPSREAIDFAWVEPTSASLVFPPVIRSMLADLARSSTPSRR
jgi:8-oxo-dGTP pyrophosphatase MutT (NUDIX family)